MDYAIYKTSNGNKPHIIDRFTQEAYNHHAKAAAQAKLKAMWLRVLQHPICCKNPTGSKDAFQYDHMTSVNTTERFRFYIAPIK